MKRLKEFVAENPGRFAFLVALVVRLLFLIPFCTSPFFVPVTGGNDRSLYVSIARRVASGELFPSGVFEYMPLYGWVLGFFFLVGGPAALLLTAVGGAGMDSLTAALIVRIARRFGASPAVALAAAVVYALYPLAMVYSSLTMPNTLNALLLMGFAAGATALSTSTPARRWLLVGLLGGVSCLGFAGMLLITVLTFAWLAVSTRSWKALLLMLGVAIPIAPISLHNTRAGGEFVLITAHGGFNFYMGNHEGATGYPMQIAGFRGDAGSLLVDARREAEREVGHKLSGREFSDYWSSKARAFFRDEPAKAARLFGLKLMRLLNWREYDDLRVLPMLKLTGVASAALWPLGFAPIVLLGIIGLAFARRVGLLKLILLATAFSLVLFFITSRYRLTLAPLACALGAIGIGQFRNLADRRVAPGLWLSALVASALTAWPLPQSDFRALDHYNAAAHLLDRGMAEEALQISDRGLAIDSRQPDLHFVRGNALFGLERLDEAIGEYETVLALKPNHAQAQFNMAVALKLKGDLPAARSAAEAALRADPDIEMAREFLRTL